MGRHGTGLSICLLSALVTSLLSVTHLFSLFSLWGVVKIWRHIYDKELGVAAEGRPLLISEASNPKVNREKMTEVMFETFKTPSLYIAKRAGLILFASGYTSGFSFHCGSGVSHCVPVYEGHTVPHALKFSFVGGSDVTYQLLKALNERGSSFESLSDVEIVRDIKEKECYVALDFEQEMQTAVASSSSLEKSYELPDGKVVTVGSERFRCPEVLFQPILLGDDYDHTLSIQQVIHRSVMKYDQDAQSAHIVVSGGSTLLPGLSDRLHKELSALAPPSLRVKLISPPHGSNSAWIGGSMLASLPTFPQMAISREEYEEFGPAIIHRKCF